MMRTKHISDAEIRRLANVLRGASHDLDRSWLCRLFGHLAHCDDCCKTVTFANRILLPPEFVNCDPIAEQDACPEVEQLVELIDVPESERPVHVRRCARCLLRIETLKAISVPDAAIDVSSPGPVTVACPSDEPSTAPLGSGEPTRLGLPAAPRLVGELSRCIIKFVGTVVPREELPAWYQSIRRFDIDLVKIAAGENDTIDEAKVGTWVDVAPIPCTFVSGASAISWPLATRRFGTADILGLDAVTDHAWLVQQRAICVDGSTVVVGDPQRVPTDWCMLRVVRSGEEDESPYLLMVRRSDRSDIPEQDSPLSRLAQWYVDNDCFAQARPLFARALLGRQRGYDIYLCALLCHVYARMREVCDRAIEDLKNAGCGRATLRSAQQFHDHFFDRATKLLCQVLSPRIAAAGGYT